MCIERLSVEKVEYPSGQDRAESHETPILRQAVDPKRLGYYGREYPKCIAIAQPRER